MKYLCLVFISLLAVYFFLYFSKQESKIPTKILKETTQTSVKLLNNEQVEEIDLEEYIIGVVACEMPALFHKEALKANAVAARTYALNKMELNNEYDLINSIDNQCYQNEEQLKQKWNDNFEEYYNKIKDAVYETKGQYLTHNNEIIKAFYFSTSNGYTENCEQVFGEKLDYLVSVDSKWDQQTKNFTNITNYTIKEFLSLLGLPDSQTIEINITNQSLTGRINTININNVEFKGTEVRKALSLKSTDFIIEDTGIITVTTKGYGHGVGMSQYGANEMANLGKTYKEILFHYYTDVELKSV